MTGWLSKWIGANKKQTYPNGWPKEKPPDPATPKNRHLQPLTHNVPANDVENANNTNKRGDLLFVNKPRTVHHKRTRRTGKLLYIHRHILKQSKTRQKNLVLAWIDYEKAYDIVSQSWIIDSLKMYKTSGGIIKLIEDTMEN